MSMISATVSFRSIIVPPTFVPPQFKAAGISISMRYTSLGIDIFERSRTFFVLSSPTNWRRNADERNPHKGVSGKVSSRSASARLDDGVFIDALQRLGSGAVCPLA